LTNWE